MRCLLATQNAFLRVVMHLYGGLYGLLQVAAEMLDTSGKVYHITNRNLNIFSEQMWKNIKVKKLSDSIFVYTKIENKNFINLNGKKNNFEKLIKKNKF